MVFIDWYMCKLGRCTNRGVINLLVMYSRRKLEKTVKFLTLNNIFIFFFRLELCTGQ